FDGVEELGVLELVRVAGRPGEARDEEDRDEQQHEHPREETNPSGLRPRGVRRRRAPVSGTALGPPTRRWVGRWATHGCSSRGGSPLVAHWANMVRPREPGFARHRA